MNNGIPLRNIVSLLDNTLEIGMIQDSPLAVNGLQIDNDSGVVHKVALAVDTCTKTIEDSIAAGADLLVVHHGIFWCGLRPLTGWWREKISLCLQHGLSIYSAHLPLDLHPTLGNNACLARKLGLVDVTPALKHHGSSLAVVGTFQGSVHELKECYAAVTGSEVSGVIHDGNAQAGKVLVCSGDAGTDIYRVLNTGVSTFLTGEQNHWVFNAARDTGLNIMFAGHYATETFGVRALGELIAQRFRIPTVFIDNPTGI